MEPCKLRKFYSPFYPEERAVSLASEYTLVDTIFYNSWVFSAAISGNGLLLIYVATHNRGVIYMRERSSISDTWGVVYTLTNPNTDGWTHFRIVDVDLLGDNIVVSCANSPYTTTDYGVIYNMSRAGNDYVTTSYVYELSFEAYRNYQPVIVCNASLTLIEASSAVGGLGGQFVIYTRASSSDAFTLGPSTVPYSSPTDDVANNGFRAFDVAGDRVHTYSTSAGHINYKLNAGGILSDPIPIVLTSLSAALDVYGIVSVPYGTYPKTGVATDLYTQFNITPYNSTVDLPTRVNTLSDTILISNNSGKDNATWPITLYTYSKW